jgi:cysteinyl-tRNA synthetase
VAITLWNTLTRTKEPLEPIEGDHVRLFVCGPTVYDLAHLGHGKTYTQFDLIARYLRHRGYRVTYLQNVTDVDDKIIDRARQLDITPKELAERNEEIYREDMEALGNTAVDTYARASDFIPQIVDQVQRLLALDRAYELPDGYYFDIARFPGYGKLAHRQDVAPEDSLARVDENPLKRNPGDFALWKKRKEGEPFWDTALGEGRPGWHVEDTAITEHFLGPQYEIHGGAVDLIFPHHEAEIAVMESISGLEPLARYWMHTGFLTLRDRKMSKSFGNTFTIRGLVEQVDPRALRFFFLRQHYRSPIAYDEELLEDAAASLRRLENYRLRLPVADDGESAEVAAVREEIYARLDDDFDTPAAFAALFEFVREEHKRDAPSAGARALLDDLNEFMQVFADEAGASDDSWVDAEIERREQLRAERRFDEADAIRDELLERDIILEDTRDGVRWHRAAAKS